MLILTMKTSDGNLLEIMEVDSLKCAIKTIKNNIYKGVRSFEIDGANKTYKGVVNKNIFNETLETICLTKKI